MIKIKWDRTLDNEFRKGLDEKFINSISHKIDEVQNELSQNTLDALYESIQTVYIEAASKANMVKTFDSKKKTF